MISTGISYEGIVRIKLKKGGKVRKSYVIHNEGTPLLFQGIALSLVKKQESGLLPNYIALGTTGEAASSYKLSNEVARVVITSSTVSPNSTLNEGGIQVADGWAAIFSATIPASSLSENVKITEIGLFGESFGDNLLARVYPKEDIITEKGMSISVEWVMIINNIKGSD